MALSILTNSTALGAMGSVNNANSKLSKTISQLSTGLRINSAADDASGLAVSEKLRGQISGLAKAASNSQDAISMLQTAEGAMGSMTDIVQRMRELSVQAGDPAYTTNDRAVLQLEMDQLKEEINRVSTSTEFNTKKLLNGDAAALWSSSSSDLEAIVKGAAAEGNYEITSLLNGGTNNVYKSNIMNLNEKTGMGKATAVNNGIQEVVNVTGIREGSSFTVLETTAAVTVTTNVFTGAYKNGNHVGTAFGTLIATNLTSAAVTAAYSVKIEANKDLNFVSNTSAATAIASALKITLTNMSTGEEIVKTVDLSVAAGAAAGSHGAVTVTAAVTVTIGTATVTLLSAASTFKAAANTVGLQAKQGDATGGFYQNAIAGIPATDTTSSIYQVKYSAGGTATFTYSMKVPNAFDEDKLVTTKMNLISYDDKGNTVKGSMTLVHEKSDKRTVGSNTYEMKMTDVANSQTLLKDIARFTNADGRNVLDNTQSLTIYGGNGKQAIITLEGSDTIADLEDKLTSAIVDQLGMGGDVSTTAGETVNENLVNFVADPATAGSDEAVNGTFVIQTALLGKDSSLSFVGDQGIIDALGVTNIQKAEDPSVTISVKDAHTGETVGSDTVTDNILRGVIDGVDLKVNAASKNNVDVTYNTTTKKMDFAAKATPEAVFLHIKDNATKAAIGANEGQIIDLSIGRMDTTSLEIDDVNVVSFENAQKSITKLDQALEKISTSRAKIGAQMNRLDYTINNLNTAQENLTASESRIRDLDIAQASSDLAARQVLLQSATAMLSQANQIPSYAAQLLR